MMLFATLQHSCYRGTCSATRPCCLCRYADIIINYLRTVATDVISRLIAAAALGPQAGLPLASAEKDQGTHSTAGNGAAAKDTSFSEMLARLFKGSRSSTRHLSSSQDIASNQQVYSGGHLGSQSVLGSSTGYRAAHIGRAMLADPRPRDSGSRTPVGSSPVEDEAQDRAEVPLPEGQDPPPGRPSIQQILTQDLMMAAALNEQEATQHSSGRANEDSSDEGDEGDSGLPGLPPALACSELVPGRRGVGFVQNCSSAVALRQVHRVFSLAGGS
jgi:hypothetical protein